MDVHLTPELEQEEELQARCVDDLRLQIDKGLAEAERGEFVDGEEFMQRLLGELDTAEAERRRT